MQANVPDVPYAHERPRHQAKKGEFQLAPKRAAGRPLASKALLWES